MRYAVVLLGLLVAPASDARILNSHTEIRIAKTGELTVTERITVEGGEKAKAPPAAQVVALRSGEGRNRYQVTYRAERRSIAFLRDHDALHWNLKGAEHVSAEVILPAAVPASSIRTEATGGEYQSFVRDGRAAFRALQPIALVVRFPKGVVAEPSIGERVQWFFSDYPGVLVVLVILTLTAWTLRRARNLSTRG
jgi:hypothetical protein